MGFNEIKLKPGVNVEFTPTLNVAAISSSNLIRFRYGLPEKLGGWTKYFNGQMPSTVRCLNSWEDLNTNLYLGIGMESDLAYISSGNFQNITPQTTTATVAVNVDTTSGSNIVTIHDTGRNANIYDSVYIKTPISIGGIVLSGLYPIYASAGASAYQILAASNATSTVTGGGAVPVFAATINSPTMTVTLNNHGYTAGQRATFLVPTTVGGVIVYGEYTVQTVPTANTFTINTFHQASTTQTKSMNNNLAYYLYYIGQGPALPGVGYGIQGYGVGGYGTGNPPATISGTKISQTDWTLDNWGQNLIACPLNGPIYNWSPESGIQNATIIIQAPPVNTGIFVAMPERQIVAYGSTFTGVQDPLLVRWSDVSDYTVWAASSVNQAGSYRIPTGSRIVGAIQASQQGLIWTDLDVWAMQYIQPPLVYGFNKISSGCGLIAQKAVAQFGPNVYWMSQKQFFMMSSSGVTPILCPVWDAIYQNLDTTYAYKIRAATNAQFNEIAWYYPSLSGGGEIDSYVKYNTVEQVWDYGSLARTAWIDQSILGSPIGSGTDRYLYQHETSPDADGVAMDSYFTTGYASMTQGEDFTFVDYMIPDMKWGYYNQPANASIKITLYVTNFPGDTPTVYGPYTVTQASQAFNTRFRGRQVAIKVESTDLGSWWRLGNIRYRYAVDGRR
jgi:hypothetical protein